MSRDLGHPAYHHDPIKVIETLVHGPTLNLLPAVVTAGGAPLQVTFYHLSDLSIRSLLGGKAVNHSGLSRLSLSRVDFSMW